MSPGCLFASLEIPPQVDFYYLFRGVLSAAEVYKQRHAVVGDGRWWVGTRLPTSSEDLQHIGQRIGSPSDFRFRNSDHTIG